MHNHDAELSAADFLVFLSYNTEDKPEVVTLRRQLDRRGIKGWLDSEQLGKGAIHERELDKAIHSVAAAVVVLGKHGVGPKQDLEIPKLVERFKDTGRLIPVLLPGVDRENIPEDLKSCVWVDLTRCSRDTEREQEIDKLEQTITGRKPMVYLMLHFGEPDTEKKFYYGRATLVQPGKRRHSSVGAVDGCFGPDKMDKMAKLLNEALKSVRKKEIDLNDLVVELFLPSFLLHADLDSLLPGEGESVRPKSYHYALVLRSWERAAQEQWVDGWRTGWKKLRPCLKSKIRPEVHIAWIDDPACAGLHAEAIEKGKPLFVWKTPPGRGADSPQDMPVALGDVLDQGVALLLWSDDPLTEEWQAEFSKELDGRLLCDLPHLIKKLRQETWNQSKEHTGHLHLLWDDCDRKPSLRPPPGSQRKNTRPLAESAFNIEPGRSEVTR